MPNPFAFLFHLSAALAAGAIGGYFVGYSQGMDKQRNQQHAQTVADLTNIIDASIGLINDSNAASKAMRDALAARSALDAKTTKDLKNALAKTAASRADCRFNDDIMRELTQAHERAAAAAAGGIRDSLPAASGSGRQPR